MATPILMPKLSPTMTEGTLNRWTKKVGETISSGDIVAEIETDKSNLEVPADGDGVLLAVYVQEGETVPALTVIGHIGEKGEKVEAPPKGAAAAPAAPSQPAPAASQERNMEQPLQKPEPQAPKQQPAVVTQGPAGTPGQGPARAQPVQAPASPRGEGADQGRLRASPLAKKIAREQGLDLSGVSGSGPNGRIIRKDVEAALAAGPAEKAAPAAAKKPGFIPTPVRGERLEPVQTQMSSMRKVIAKRMAEVKPGVPHFYLTVEVEMDAAMKIREEAKAIEAKVSVNDIIVKAAAVALRRVPKMNVSLQGDQILQFQNADVGIAVSIEDGLITPVIKDADLKGLASVSAESRELAERARRRALKPEEYSGGSITVSNLGMYGMDAFVAVINPPQAAILAVGAVSDKAVVRNGELVARKIMTATLSCDHRIIDGALGAQYLSEVKSLLEHPMRLLF